jgi:lamin tail-like protein
VTFSLSFRAARRVFAFPLLLAASSFIASCGGDDPAAPPPPVLTTVNVTLPAATITMGQTTTATAAGLDQNGAPIAAGTISWSSSAPAIATVDASGLVRGVTDGTASIVATAGTITGQASVTVRAPAAIKINEIESSGGTPGDWVELFNPTGAPVDVSGWVVKDNDDTHIYTFPNGTSIAAGGYLLAEEASLGYGLGAPDAVRLFNQFGASVDAYDWTAHAATTYGRCPNATGAFITTTSSTKGAANACTPAGPSTAPWPGSDDVQTADGNAVFGGNLSGLTYEGAKTGSPAVLWAVRNGPGTLYRLIAAGGIMTPDPAGNWSAGKALRYPGGAGNPDAEGVTFAANGSAGGIYVATERNNDASTISKNAVLRFDPSQTGATLTATNEWNLTSDLPVVGANLGIEAITWVPDAFLTARNFFDETANHAYDPAEYANHGTGLFFVGVEANGSIYAYALDHTANTAKRIATISTGFPGVMGLELDAELGYLWATCDDGCGGKSGILEIDAAAGSPTRGKFIVTHQYDRPSTMPNVNNEGFAFTPQAECANGKKPVFWSDDSETGGHSIRRASIPCSAFPATAVRLRP